MRYSYGFGHPPALIVPVRIGKRGGTASQPLDGRIDTGADATLIPTRLVAELRLRATDFANVRGILQPFPMRLPVYLTEMHIERCGVFDAKVIAYPRADALLGRDLLNRLVMLADGPAGFFELSAP